MHASQVRRGHISRRQSNLARRLGGLGDCRKDLVMGTHGHTALHYMLLGSSAETVFRTAP
jgi:hypothetical protein